jgi:hypothetical protein
MDVCEPFQTAEGELASGDLNRLRTPDPPHGFWRAMKIPDLIRSV